MTKEQIMDKKWVISQSQWQLLLSQFGEEIKYGIYFQYELQGKRQVIENLYEMVKGGILLPEKGKLVIASEYRRLLEISARAKKGCYVENKEEGGNFFIYLEEESVLCEPSPARKNCFLFSIKKREEILDYLLENNYFPMYQIESNKDFLQKESSEVWDCDKVKKSITFFDITKEEKLAQILITNEKGEEYLIWEERDDRGKKLLSEKCLKKVWKELMDNVVCRSAGTHI